MRAVIDGTTVAEADKADLIRIEGNWYFSPVALTEGVFHTSPTPYTCAWKGEAQYFTASVGGKDYVDTAWSYPEPPRAAIDRVGADFSRYVAFDPSVELIDD